MNGLETKASETPDEELALLFLAGDEMAFERLVVRHRQRVYRLARRLLGDDSDAQDVTQETFIQVYRKLSSFRGDSRFSTWLYRIATNAALMRKRADSRRPTESLDSFAPRFDEAGLHAATVAELSAPGLLEETLDARVLAERVQAAVDRLPDLYRRPFVLRDLEEIETSEVAELLGLETATVRQRVHRARILLRGYLSSLAEVKQ
jgi:RNA polymerase sigma-70 factor (ECF subfamily)